MWTIQHALLFLIIALPASFCLMALLAKLEKEREKDKND